MGCFENSNLRSFLDVLRADGVVSSPHAKLTPLTGGVSSEIYRVDDGSDVFVVKRALSKLRVSDDWLADISRNHYEQLYLSYVAQFLPSTVPAIRCQRPGRGYFAMEWLGNEFVNWKQVLLSGKFVPDQAVRAAGVLSKIHVRSAGDAQAAETFNTTANFHELRADPYLLTIATRHPRLRGLIEAEVKRLEATRLCLVHGDFSPKNILFRDDRLVLLDCEVAWYGDPAFDLAFLLNHLFLKSLYHAPRNLGGRAMVEAFWEAYTFQACEHTFDRAGLDERIARLLLTLMLARVDGKSPVEYFADSEPRKQFVREFATSNLTQDGFSLAYIIDSWFAALETVAVGSNRTLSQSK
jgi:aminoglycoside phosphotransferase (APT) family kinase protein